MKRESTPDRFNHTDDPLRKTYRESFVEAPQHMELLESRGTALLCIDMQYLDAADGYGVFSHIEARGVPKTGRRYYFTSFASMGVAQRACPSGYV